MKHPEDIPSDVRVYQDLVDLLTKGELEEMHRGAYFQLDDHGLYALKWRGLPGAQVRLNSHPYEGDAFSIQGEIFPEFLCSTRQIEGRNYTWFQAERAGVRNAPQCITHTLHWMYHLVMGRNVGPDGTSLHMHTNPIYIDADRISGSRHRLLS